MDEQKKYRPVIGEDKDYHIKEPSGGIYKELKMLMLHSAVSGVPEKLAIAKEFKLIKDFTDKEELKKFEEKLKQEEINIEQFMESVFKSIFIEKNDVVKFDSLNLNQVSKAISDFFTLASGS